MSVCDGLGLLNWGNPRSVERNSLSEIVHVFSQENLRLLSSYHSSTCTSNETEKKKKKSTLVFKNE